MQSPLGALPFSLDLDSFPLPAGAGTNKASSSFPYHMDCSVDCAAKFVPFFDACNHTLGRVFDVFGNDTAVDGVASTMVRLRELLFGEPGVGFECAQLLGGRRPRFWNEKCPTHTATSPPGALQSSLSVYQLAHPREPHP